MNTLAGADENISAQGNIDSRMRIEIREIGIPPRPAILNDIDREMAKDEPDFRLMAKLIGSDVALAAGLIKTANSPFYGFGKKVRTVQEAMLVLGLKLVTRTIAGLVFQKLFPYVPSLERFWDASANTARASGWLTQRLKSKSAVRSCDAYTFALFRDCGIPILMIPFPEYLAVLQQANLDNAQSFTTVEHQLISISHSDIGAELAENWLLPADICSGIRHHHEVNALCDTDVSELSMPARQLIAIAQIAEYLVQQKTGLNRTCEWEKLGAACLNVIQLSNDDLTEILDEYISTDSDNEC